MNIQVNTDNHIQGSDDLNRHLETTLFGQLKRYNIAITRIEVHLSENKEGMRCKLEARVSNRPPVVTSHLADNLHLAIKVATEKLLRSLDSMVGKMTDHKDMRQMHQEEQREVDAE